MKSLDPNQGCSQLAQQGIAPSWGEPSAWGAGDGTEPHVLGALAAPAPPELILCSCSPSEPVRGSSTPCLHSIRSVVNCLPTQPHHRQTRPLKVTPQWSLRSRFKRSCTFTAWPKDHSPRLFAVSHIGASTQAPGDKGTLSLASSNITIYSLANTFWCLDKNPELDYTLLVSCVQVAPEHLTNAHSLKIAFWWWIQGLWAFQVTLTVC